jgi:hypothetical protein
MTGGSGRWGAEQQRRAQRHPALGAVCPGLDDRGGAQTPSPAPTPEWGLHLLDANLSLGNLISIVKAESTAYLARR